MQTFVPVAAELTGTAEDVFRPSLEVLDYRRLGKQRIETKQIYQALTIGTGWKNHPATKMWSGYEHALLEYGRVSCLVWIEKGYRDTTLAFFVEHLAQEQKDSNLILPAWFGDEKVHSSHRANLLRKNIDFYSQYGWEEEPTEGYFWPKEL